MSKQKVMNAVTKALVGTEKLAPEVEAAARGLVSESGRINQEALGKRRLLGDLLIGKKGTIEALKARYQQGGILGPGGLIMGEFALDPRYKQLIKNYRQSSPGSSIVDPYSGGEMTRSMARRKLLTKGVGQSVNPLFLLGFPAMDLSTAIKTDSSDEHGGMSGILGALAGGAGFAMGGPLGLVGGLGASMIGEGIGKSVGGLFDPAPSTGNVLSADRAARIPRASDLILDAAIPT